ALIAIRSACILSNGSPRAESPAMSDWRLQSGHLDVTRRQHYRRARQDLLESRGLLTSAIQRVEGWGGESPDWPSLLPFQPHQFLPGIRFVLLDRHSGITHPLKTGVNTIGRFPENDIVFEEIAVSRRHCAVLIHARGECEIHDTASMNGTFVNGERIDRA